MRCNTVIVIPLVVIRLFALITPFAVRAVPVGWVRCYENKEETPVAAATFVCRTQMAPVEGLSATKIYQIPRSVIWVRAGCVGGESQSI